MSVAAGTVLYRYHDSQLEVLIVHPAGNYNRHKPWSIPKGMAEDGESLEEAARRETMEEAGVTAGDLVPLGHVIYTKSRKTVHAFAGLCSDGTPVCDSWEVDEAMFVPIARARQVLHPDQRAFLDRLEQLLGG